MSTLSRSKKAAALVLAMGPDAASSVFRHLTDAEVELIAREVASLGDVPTEEVGTIVDEFLGEAQSRSQTLTGGPEYAARIIRTWRSSVGEAEVREEVDRVLGLDAARPFVFLRDYDPAQIAAALEDEHPQTIALVLANLSARQAGKVLVAFQDDLQSAVAMRVATIRPVGARSIRLVEEALRRTLGPPRASTSGVETGGAREAATMLNQLGRERSESIIEHVRSVDAELANRIREMMFVFEDIVTLDDRAIQEVLRAVEPQSLAIAMKGLDESVANIIWRNLSERAGTALQEELELLGPLPKTDIDEARTKVVKSVQQLADEGTITISMGGGEDLVA